MRRYYIHDTKARHCKKKNRKNKKELLKIKKKM